LRQATDNIEAVAEEKNRSAVLLDRRWAHSIAATLNAQSVFI